MAPLPVPQSEVRGIYMDLADDVANRERRLGEELPVGRTFDIPARLLDAVDNWETGRKSLRTVPACNVYARHCDDVVPQPVIRTMTGLDAVINMLDDIIDTKGLTTETKVALTLNVAFSTVLMVEGCPPAAKQEVNDNLLEYFTAVFQIPLVERKLFTRMKGATTKEDRLAAAESFYAYRARDIDAFARIPAAVMDVDDEERSQLLSDLRTYRARRLMFKDIHDVERDIADGDTNPLIHLLRTADGTQDVVSDIEDLYARFTYSDAGQRIYGDILQELEDPPANLHSVIRRTRAAVLEPAV